MYKDLRIVLKRRARGCTFMCEPADQRLELLATSAPILVEQHNETAALLNISDGGFKGVLVVDDREGQGFCTDGLLARVREGQHVAPCAAACTAQQQQQQQAAHHRLVTFLQSGKVDEAMID